MNHDLEEIPLKGRAYTWSNMQLNPLLEKLDWIFTNAEWTSTFPNSMATPLAKISSDHVPIHIQIVTHIPKSNIFRWISGLTLMDFMTQWPHIGTTANTSLAQPKISTAGLSPSEKA